MPTDTFPPTIDELLETFDELEDWDERYDFLIDLGRELPPLPAEYQTERYKVSGCMSSVWMMAKPCGDHPPRLEILADSDSLIVKGLITLLLALYNGKNVDEILGSDPQQLFARMGLNQHLSATRRNGLYAMLKRIRELAEEARQNNAR